jgi:hypothetical protein
MFGSFLPSLWSSSNQSLLGSREPTLLCNQVPKNNSFRASKSTNFGHRESISCDANLNRGSGQGTIASTRRFNSSGMGFSKSAGLTCPVTALFLHGELPVRYQIGGPCAPHSYVTQASQSGRTCRRTPIRINLNGAAFQICGHWKRSQCTS